MYKCFKKTICFNIFVPEEYSAHMGNKAGFGLYDLWLFSAAAPSGQGVRFTCPNIGAIWDALEYPSYPHKAGQHYPGVMGHPCPSGTATGPGNVLGHLKCH